MKKHFTGLDALRGVAALAVVAYHRRWWAEDGLPLGHGHLAVEFFFVLSGWVIAHAYETRLAGGGMTFREFVIARLIRLGPMLVIGGVIGGLFVLGKVAVGRHPLDAETIAALIAAPLGLPTPLPMWLLNECPFPINPPTWSLFFEVLVNLGFGLIASGLRTRWLVLLVAGSFAIETACVLSSGTVYRMGNTYPELWMGLPRTAAPFFLGVLLYRWHEAGVLPRFQLPWPVLGVAVLATLTPPATMPGNAWYELACIALVYPAIVVIGANREPASGWSSRLAQWSGAISYPVYILHYPIYYWLDPVGRQWPGGITLVLVVTLITALSWLALVWLDEPVRRWLSTRRRRQALARTA